MQHAALAGVGGREAVGHAGVADTFGCGFGGELDLLGAQGLEVEGVEADQIVFADVEAKDLDGDVLEGARRSSPPRWVSMGASGPASSTLRICAPAVSERSGAGAGADAVFEAQTAEMDDGVEEIGDLLGGLLEVGDWHDKQVSQIGRGRREFSA